MIFERTCSRAERDNLDEIICGILLYFNHHLHYVLLMLLTVLSEGLLQ
jgi:hypothetical protein